MSNDTKPAPPDLADAIKQTREARKRLRNGQVGSMILAEWMAVGAVCAAAEREALAYEVTADQDAVIADLRAKLAEAEARYTTACELLFSNWRCSLHSGENTPAIARFAHMPCFFCVEADRDRLRGALQRIGLLPHVEDVDKRRHPVFIYSTCPTCEVDAVLGDCPTCGHPVSGHDPVTDDCIEDGCWCAWSNAQALAATGDDGSLQSRVTAWAREMFPDADDDSRLLHVQNELFELVDDPDDPYEAADMVLILMHHASAHDYDLLAVCEAKFAEVQKRPRERVRRDIDDEPSEPKCPHGWRDRVDCDKCQGGGGE